LNFIDECLLYRWAFDNDIRGELTAIENFSELEELYGNVPP
jgi:hypothetical protein